MPLLCARAGADPALLDGDLAGGAWARSHTVAIANHVGREAGTREGVHLGRRRVAVQESKPAGVITDASWHAILGVVAGLRRIGCDLK